MDLGDPLPQFRGQLDAVLFHGLVGPADHQSPGEGAPDTRFGMISGWQVHDRAEDDPVDELWLHHVPSRTVIAGENLAWYYPPGRLRGQPFMLRVMIKPDQVCIWTSPARWATRGGRGVLAPLLAWPARTLMTYHDVPGHRVRRRLPDGAHRAPSVAAASWTRSDFPSPACGRGPG